MLRIHLLLLFVIMISIPVAYADSVNSTINEPSLGYLFSNSTRDNDVSFSENSLESWNTIITIQAPNVEPIFFPILVLIIFGLSFSAGIKSNNQINSSIFLVLSFLMALVLVLLFSGNLEYGILQEETTSDINTNTGIINISKTYHSVKIIPTNDTFRPIFTGIFYLLFFVSLILLILKSFLIPTLNDRKDKNEKNSN